MDNETYKRYTDLFHKENDLIKNRLGWLFGTQSLLFGIFKIPAVNTELQCIITRVGFWSSILYFVSILAAVITYLKFNFIHPHIEDSQKDNYPEFNRWPCVLIFGFISALGMPIVFVCAWYYLF